MAYMIEEADDQRRFLKAGFRSLNRRILNDSKSRLTYSSASGCITFDDCSANNPPNSGSYTMLSLDDYFIDDEIASWLKPLPITSLSYALGGANTYLFDLFSISKYFPTWNIVRLFLDMETLKDDIKTLNEIFTHFPKLRVFHWRNCECLIVDSDGTKMDDFEAISLPTDLEVLELRSVDAYLRRPRKNTHPLYQPVQINKTALCKKITEWKLRLRILVIDILVGQYIVLPPEGNLEGNQTPAIPTRDLEDIKQDWKSGYEDELDNTLDSEGTFIDWRIRFNLKCELPEIKAVRGLMLT
ncbi:hypothetical protein TWF481_002781 [Arthrobotrys musiformis]|uniref:F-box domain-containing protein n=1 Tax=Arthrobotrys musiformis TaxID=47236 RepID=A0AAV9VTC5_9PEZI